MVQGFLCLCVCVYEVVSNLHWMNVWISGVKTVMDKAKQAGESSHVSVRGAPKAKSIIQLFIK